MPVRVSALVALGALAFAVVTTVNAVNKGGDAAVFFEGGRRFLHVEPLYTGSSAADGFIGPPFQALFFASFAAIAERSPVAARLAWNWLSLACLAAAVLVTVRWWNGARAGLNLQPRTWVALVSMPLVAVLLPLLTNFEHQNMNAVLLALLTAATWQLTMGSAVIAGILIGVATALKAFPAIVILYLVVRRMWKAAIAAAATAAIASTLVPLAMYGVDGFLDLAQTFWRLSTSGWPVRGNNQSLIAAIDRLITGVDGAGVRQASETPMATIVSGALALVLLGAFVAMSLMRQPTRAGVAVEITAVTVLAILLSPIAWDHYWTLLFPAYLIVFDSRDPRLLGPRSAYLFWGAAVLTSGLSPLTLGGAGFNLARYFGTYTIAAIVIYAALLWLRSRMSDE